MTVVNFILDFDRILFFKHVTQIGGQQIAMSTASNAFCLSKRTEQKWNSVFVLYCIIVHCMDFCVQKYVAFQLKNVIVKIDYNKIYTRHLVKLWIIIA